MIKKSISPLIVEHMEELKTGARRLAWFFQHDIRKIFRTFLKVIRKNLLVRMSICMLPKKISGIAGKP